MLTKMLSQAGGSNPIDNLNGSPGNPAAAGRSGMVSALSGSQRYYRYCPAAKN